MSEEFPSPRPLPPGPNGHEHAASGASATMAMPEPMRAYAVPGDEEQAHFWDYWQILDRHRWTVISFFLVTVVVAMLWTLTTRPTYTASVTLRIEPEEPKIIKFDDVLKESASQQDYYQTQYKLLRNRTLASRVIDLLQLDRHREFGPEESWLARARSGARAWLVKWLPAASSPMLEARPDIPRATRLTDAYLARLSVEPVRNSRLVKLSFESDYPDLAAQVANTAAQAFITQQLDQKLDATRYATQFLTKQLDDTRHMLEEAEGKLNRFMTANNILFVSSGASGPSQDLITQQLSLLSDSFLKARSERIAKEGVVAQASRYDIGNLPAVSQSPLIAHLRQELATQEEEYERLGQIFKPQYPRMQQLAQKIAESRRHLQAEVARVVESLQADYQAAVRTEREMEGVLVQHRTLSRRLSDRMAEYNLLRREVDTGRELYTALLARLRETQISSGLVTSNISIVEAAEVPPGPSRPHRSTNLLVAVLLGLVGGVGLAFVWEYLDTNIKDVKEVETVLRVPILGLVPRRRPARRRSFALLCHAETASVFAEAFRSLRTTLLYSAPDRPPKTLVVTSLQPEDGKTSLVTNLAITLAQLGAGQVLLVDADMRRPSIHRILGIRPTPGLSTFLTGQAELGEVIRPTTIPNLFAVPSGRTSLAPSELIASARFRQALPVLGEGFAHVIFDAGPLFGVSEAMILATQVEGVVLVLRRGRATREAAQRAIRNLLSVRARLLGVILNDVAGNGYHRYYGGSDCYGNGPRPRTDAAQTASGRGSTRRPT